MVEIYIGTTTEQNKEITFEGYDNRNRSLTHSLQMPNIGEQNAIFIPFEEYSEQDFGEYTLLWNFYNEVETLDSLGGGAKIKEKGLLEVYSDNDGKITIAHAKKEVI